MLVIEYEFSLAKRSGCCHPCSLLVLQYIRVATKHTVLPVQKDDYCTHTVVKRAEDCHKTEDKERTALSKIRALGVRGQEREWAHSNDDWCSNRE